MRLRVRCAALALWAGVVNAQVPPPLVDYHQHFFSPDLAKLVGVDTIDADKLIRLLDAAGIRRALVLSTAYSWSNPSRNVENDYEHVKADNDWTAAQVARYPERLREIGRASCRERVWVAGGGG